MKLRMVAAVLALSVAVPISGACWAQEAKLDDAGIVAALSGQVLTYDDGSIQVFSHSGRTTYTAGSESQGSWRVTAGQYCSVWPPSDRWACYDVRQSADGQTVTFVAGDGSTSVGRRSP